MYGPYRFSHANPGDEVLTPASAPASPQPPVQHEGEARPAPFSLPTMTNSPQDRGTAPFPSSPLRADATLSPGSATGSEASRRTPRGPGGTPRTRQRRFFAISAADLDSDTGSEGSALTPTRPARRAQTAYGRARRGRPAPPARGSSFTSRAVRPGARFRVISDGGGSRAELQRGKPSLATSFRQQQESMRRLASSRSLRSQGASPLLMDGSSADQTDSGYDSGRGSPMYVPHGSLYNVEAMLVPAPNHYKSDEAKMKLLKRQPSFSIPQQKRNVTRLLPDTPSPHQYKYQTSAFGSQLKGGLSVRNVVHASFNSRPRLQGEVAPTAPAFSFGTAKTGRGVHARPSTTVPKRRRRRRKRRNGAGDGDAGQSPRRPANGKEDQTRAQEGASPARRRAAQFDVQASASPITVPRAGFTSFVPTSHTDSSSALYGVGFSSKPIRRASSFRFSTARRF